MNDPFSRTNQTLTDALLNLDRTISLAESNVAAAKQLGLPEAGPLAARLPDLVLQAREFLARIPDGSQPQRWIDARRLLDKARSFEPMFAPYMMLGTRVAAAKQAVADQLARAQAAAEAARRAQSEREALALLDTARKRFSTLRQTLADMQLQRGPGYDDEAWLQALRSVASILTAQDVRLSGAAGSVRDGAFDQAHAQLDQTMGELQAALDLANRARTAAAARSQQAAHAQVAPAGTTIPMPSLSVLHITPVEQAPPIVTTQQQQAIAAVQPTVPRVLSLIELRNGTLFRCDVGRAVIGRGLNGLQVTGDLRAYIDLSRACDPGEAEYLGVSRRHAEVERKETGWTIQDLNSTNGTRLRHARQDAWTALAPLTPVLLQEGDTVQFGLLECTVSLS